MTQKQSVVIIGGGPAGLTAAWELVKDGGSENYDVTVLEATREFGGISRTVKHDGNRMDIGGHRFFSKDERIMDWWKGVLPLQGAPSYDDKKLGREHDMEPGGPDPEVEDKVMLKRHRVSRIYWNRHFFDYPGELLHQSFRPQAVFHVLRGVHREAVGSPSVPDFRRLGCAARQGPEHYGRAEERVPEAPAEEAQQC